MWALNDYGSSSDEEDKNKSDQVEFQPPEPLDEANSEFSVKNTIQICAAPPVISTVSFLVVFVDCELLNLFIIVG